MIEARIESAISAGDARADVEPGGRVDPRRAASSATPSARSASSTAAPRLRLATRPTYADAGLQSRAAGSRSSSRPCAATTSARSSADGHRRPVVVPPGTIASSPSSGAEAQERRGDRRVTGHDHPRRGQERLEEHLDRAARQARVLHGDRAVVVRDLLTDVFAFDLRRARRGGSAAAAARRARSPSASTGARCAARTRRRRTPRSSRPRGRAPRCPAWRWSDAGRAQRWR